MKKVIVWGGVIAAILYLSSTASAKEAEDDETWQPATNEYEGKVVKRTNDTKLYRVYNGRRILYENQQAYINDGSRPIITLTEAQISKIPETTNDMFFEVGGLQHIMYQ
jgi:hypothetical protein